MKRTGPTSRADLTQDAIVEALERVGVQVKRVGYPLDLLVAVRRADGHWQTMLLECKNGEGRLTKDQEAFMAFWLGEWHIVRTPDEAVLKVLGEKVMA